MGEWFADNWYVVLLLVIYLIERSPEVLKSLKEHAANKAAAREADKLIGGADPEAEDHKQSRSRARKVARGVLHLLPFISRIKRIGK
jgi:hypothetical protein